MNWAALGHGVILGAIGGTVGGTSWLWNPWERRRRKRRLLAYRSMLRAQRSIANGEQLVAFCHVEDALRLLENRDPLPPPEVLRSEMDLERAKFYAGLPPKDAS